MTNIFRSNFPRITFRMTSKMLCSRFDDNRLFLSGGDFSGHLFAPSRKSMEGWKEAKRLMEEIFWKSIMENILMIEWKGGAL